MEKERKTNILMVMANTRMGGVQAFVLNVLRNIDFSHYQIDFAINFYAESNGIENECLKYGCKFYVLPYFKIFNYFQYYSAWNNFLNSHKYDIVYAHATNSASIFLGIARKLGMKTIAHSHSAGYRGNCIEQFFKKYFAKRVGSVADYWFACSDKAAMRLYGDSYKKYQFFYNIPNAIDSNKYLFSQSIREQIRHQLGVEKDTFLCGHLGTFSPVKNHRFLIEVFAEVLKIKPNSKLVCCGAGALMPEIILQVQNLGLQNNVIFTGVVNNANEYMMAMDCFIFPSFFEGFPVSVLEAQASGLPIVMHDVITKEVDLTDLIQRVSLNQSATEWAHAVIDTKVDDRQGYNNIISNSIYNIKTFINNFEELLNNLIKK